MNDLNEEKSSKLKSIVLTILFITVLGIGGFFGYKYIFVNGNKQLFTSAVKDEVKRLSNANQNIEIKNSYTADFEGNMHFETSNEDSKEILSLLSEIEISGKVQTLNDYSYGLFLMKYNEKELFTMEQIRTGNKLYMYLKDLYDKFIEIDSEPKPVFEINDYNFAEEDMTPFIPHFINIGKSFYNSVESVLTDNDISKKWVTLNGERVTKLTVEINKDLHNRITKSLKENEDFITSVIDLTKQMESEATKEDIIKYIDEIEYTKESISIYLNEDDIVKVELFSDGVNVTLEQNEESITFTVQDEEMELSIKVTVNDPKTITMEITMKLFETNDEMYINMKMNFTDEEVIKKEIDPNNIIKIENIKEEDFAKWGEKLAENEAFIELFSKVYGIEL